MSFAAALTSRSRHALTAITALAATLATTSASAIVITFSDSAFDSADYTATASYESDPFVIGGYFFLGDALQVFHVRPGEAQWAGAIGFINNTFVYDPLTQGPLTSIDASIDKALLLAIADLNGYSGPLGNSFRPLISQGGLYYIATIPGPAPPDADGDGYFSFTPSSTIAATGLLATNFSQYDFTTGASWLTNHPNFLAGEMRFGLAQLASTSVYTWDTALIAANYDNIRLNLNTVAVPEPTTLSLLGQLCSSAALFIDAGHACTNATSVRIERSNGALGRCYY